MTEPLASRNRVAIADPVAPALALDVEHLAVVEAGGTGLLGREHVLEDDARVIHAVVPVAHGAPQAFVAQARIGGQRLRWGEVVVALDVPKGRQRVVDADTQTDQPQGVGVALVDGVAEALGPDQVGQEPAEGVPFLL